MVLRSVCVYPNKTFLFLGLGSDQTEPLDLSIHKKYDNDDADATTLTKNNDDDVHAAAAA